MEQPKVSNPKENKEGLKKKVLVVEDTIFERIKLVGMLESFGYEVFVAGNEEDALEMVRVHNPDIVTMDGRLGSTKDGVKINQRELDVAKKIREKDPKIKILMITTEGQAFEGRGLFKEFVFREPDKLKMALENLFVE